MRTRLLISMIASASLWRIFFSSGALANFSPVGAIALFGGCYFLNKKIAFVATIACILISDLFLNYFIYFGELKLFYDGIFLNYFSIALIVLIGTLIKKVKFESILLCSSLAAFTHWLISDIGVWLYSPLYPKTFEGLITCFVAALPFLQNMLLGNLFFSFLLFGLFEYANNKLLTKVLIHKNPSTN